MTEAQAEYQEQRERDWAAFVSGDGPPADYWERWAERSHGWRPALMLLQPVGLDRPTLFEPLRPLLETLAELEEVELPPVEFLHLPALLIGFMMSTDISFAEMENICLYAAPHIKRGPPFPLHVGGVSAREDVLYLGVDDGFQLRDVRSRAAAGTVRVAQALREDAAVDIDGADRFVPTIPFAYCTGHGDRARLIRAVEPFRELALGEYRAPHVDIGRILSEPQVHFPDVVVEARVPLAGEPASAAGGG